MLDSSTNLALTVTIYEIAVGNYLWRDFTFFFQNKNIFKNFMHRERNKPKVFF